MKSIMTRTLYVSLMAVAVFFVSCSKDGSAGPEGPAGPAGPVGPGGPAGPAGPAGTANVIYSAWLDVAFDTLRNQQGAAVGFDAVIPAPKLTDAILSNGEIKVYINWGTATALEVDPLPLYDAVYLGGLNITTTFYKEEIYLASNGDVSTVTGPNGKQLQYRYILIPGGQTARQAPAVDWKNYKAVQEYLGLKD